MAEDEYRANFLWPHEEGSIEQLGYEFANGKTEKYLKSVWKQLVKRIRKSERKRMAREDMARSFSETSIAPALKEAVMAKAIQEVTATARLAYRLDAIRGRRKGIVVTFGLVNAVTGEWLLTWGKHGLKVGDKSILDSPGITIDFQKFVRFE